MPRIYTGENDPIDFCADCFPSEKEARDLFGYGEGPDNRGNCFAYNADHPPYDPDDEMYTCAWCGDPLSEADD